MNNKLKINKKLYHKLVKFINLSPNNKHMQLIN